VFDVATHSPIEHGSAGHNNDVDDQGRARLTSSDAILRHSFSSDECALGGSVLLCKETIL
jgi:hypothetical protein